MISFSKHDPSFLMMCPKYFIFLSFTVPLRVRLRCPAFASVYCNRPYQCSQELHFCCYFDIMALPDTLKICSYCRPLCQSHTYLSGTVNVSGNCRSQIHEGVYVLQGFLIYPDLTCSPCCCH